MKSLLTIQKRQTFFIEHIQSMVTNKLQSCEPGSTRYVDIQQNLNLSDEQRFSQLYALDSMLVRYVLCHDVVVIIASHHTEWRRSWTLLRPRLWNTIYDIPEEIFQSVLEEIESIVSFYRDLSTPDAKQAFDKYFAFLFFLNEHQKESRNQLSSPIIQETLV